jgi:lipid-A-disaccharide synthase
MNIRKILVLAGEESGIVYAERLKDALQEARPDEVMEFRGYQNEGFKTSDLAVMGIWPVLRRLFFFLGVARTMKRVIREWRPEAVVTVDYPGLNLKLAAYAKSLGIPAVHVVCPQVWAWHQGRIPKVAAALTKLLCFFPFEPALFRGTGLDARFIGHPLVDMFAAENAGAPPARTKGSAKTLALLPGSRLGEIQRIMPRLLAALHLLADKGVSDVEIRIPAANEKAYAEIERLLRLDPPPAAFRIEVVRGKAREILRHADCAAVASGTATLEAALARCPTVLVYAVSPLFAWIARRVIKGVRHVGLANVIAEKAGTEPPMPELLQEAFTPGAVADHLARWLGDAAAREEAVVALDATMALLKSGGDALGLAAREVLATIHENRQGDT